MYTTGVGVRAARVENGSRSDISGQRVEEEEEGEKGVEERTRLSSVMYKSERWVEREIGIRGLV